MTEDQIVNFVYNNRDTVVLGFCVLTGSCFSFGLLLNKLSTSISRSDYWQMRIVCSLGLLSVIWVMIEYYFTHIIIY